MDTQAIIRSRDDLARIVSLREKELRGAFETMGALQSKIKRSEAVLLECQQYLQKAQAGQWGNEIAAKISGLLDE